jgi:hypothetical protein
MFDRAKKQQLIERQLGLRHKLKVNEAGPTPQNHKEMASLAVANSELDDEIAAIDEFLGMVRSASRQEKLAALIKEHGDPRGTKPKKA